VAVPVQTRCAHRLPAGGQVRVPPVDDVMAGGQGRCRRPTVELAVTGVAYYDLQHVTLVPLALHRRGRGAAARTTGAGRWAAGATAALGGRGHGGGVTGDVASGVTGPHVELVLRTR